MKIRCTLFLTLLMAGTLAMAADESDVEEDFASLFDGKTLAGWTQKNGTAAYQVEDHAIVGTTAKGSPNSFLCTDKQYGNFDLRFDVKLIDNQLNSGVQIRSQTKSSNDPEKLGRVNGPQVEIEASGANGAHSGYVYGEACGGWMTPGPQRKKHQHFKNGEWNSYRIVANGARIQTWINGQPIGDLTDEGKLKSHPLGFIGLQVHGVGDRGPFQVAWRNIRIKEFAADAATAEASRIDALAGKDSPLKKGEVIAFFGDSITQAGAGKGGYCKLIADAIAEQRPELGVRPIYAGISGHKVPNLQGRLDRDVLSKQPTVVFIYIGINDVWHSSSSRGTPKDQFDAGLRDLVKKITDAGATVVLATPSVIGEKTDGSNKLDAMLEEYAEISRKVAKDTGATLCDLRVAFIERLKQINPDNKQRGLLTSDGVHLNAAGNRFVAEQTALSIAAALKARQVSMQLPKIEETALPQPAAVREPGEKTSARSLAAGPVPKWIWAAADGDACQLTKSFAGGATAAHLLATCDNRMVVYLNGRRAAASDTWEAPVKTDVSKLLLPGENQIRVEAANESGHKGFALKLVLTMPDGSQRFVVTDKSWRATTDANAADKNAADKNTKADAAVKVLGAMGTAPWGNVFQDASAIADAPSQSGRGVFNVLPGFQVELLYTVPKESQGSWVSIAFDDKGRLIASDQGDKGLFRITPSPIGSSEPTKVEKIEVPMTSCQGLLYAFDKLYCVINQAGDRGGFYAVEDTDGDDKFDKVTKLKWLNDGGEHGPHGVRLSPDGKSLYVVSGNHTNPPEKFDHSRVPRNWGEDHLLPRQWDARGHARNRLAPGGWVAKTDPDGKTWEIFSSGYRNPYDMDFNADGELFVYDADMEWDLGMPWYRPTRVSHSPSGSEFGWRTGTSKWPTYYVDSLPATVDIGPGSPVGVTFGYGAKFPAKYQKALYILDWTFGTIYAIHLEPAGASYQGVKKDFLWRTPLPLTDAAIGPDGALYFTIGGRGTQSALYRVTYNGEESTDPVDARDSRFADLRKLRRQMEALHERAGSDAIDKIWPQLGHTDRHIRYAARVALEHQEVALWQDRVLAEKDPRAAIQAVVALARQGEPDLQPQLLAALGRLDIAKLNEARQLDALRAYQLVFIRTGKPDARAAAEVVKRLDPLYPAHSDRLNRELSQLLVYLDSPTVAGKTLKLLERQTETRPAEMAALLARNKNFGGTIAKMLANQPEIEKLHLAFTLRNLRYGWTIEQRQRYFDFLNASATKSGGVNYQGFIKNIRKEALANASEAERAALIDTSPPPKPVDLPKPKGPGRAWTVDEVATLAGRGLVGRDFNNGQRSFAAARCIVCHRFDGVGGATGPDLTNVAGRFSYRDLAESLINPSKVISDQYGASIIESGDGRTVTGRVVGDDGKTITVQTDPEDATIIVEIAKDNVELVAPSRVSLMPDKLLEALSEQEVLDLIAYLMSRGNPADPIFAE